MATFGQSDELHDSEFRGVDLSRSRFVGCDLVDVVMRAVDVTGAEIDAPWLLEGDGSLIINGVNVVPLVDAELDRRFPGREQRRAGDPAGLQSAWGALEATWGATLDRAAALPDGAVDRSVAGEWSFAQTLRHLVLATDTWLGRAILDIDQPYHPLGQANAGADRVLDMSIFVTETPAYDDVLAARADRQAMVRDYLATVTPDTLTEPRRNPWSPDHEETVLACLHTILEEEWEHHRYAVRDLEVIDTS